MAPDHVVPGVYIEEVPSGRRIQAVPTGECLLLCETKPGDGSIATAESSKGLLAIQPEASDTAVYAATKAFFENGGKRLHVARLKSLDPEFAGQLAGIDLPRFDLVVAAPPDGSDLDADRIAAIAAFCEERGALHVVPAPEHWFSGGRLDPRMAETGHSIFGQSAHTAVYGPRAASTSGAVTAAAVAGVMARTDATRGVWKAPAGSDAALRGVTGLAADLSDADMARLRDIDINAIKAFPRTGPVVWGARTRAGAGEYRYVPVRWFALFLEQSVTSSLEWVVFEPNDEPLWARLRAIVEDFLQDLFRQGAFAGTRTKDAYFVTCDRTAMTQNDIDSGRVRLLIGFAPLKPAEFVVIVVTLKTA